MKKNIRYMMSYKTNILFSELFLYIFNMMSIFTKIILIL